MTNQYLAHVFATSALNPVPKPFQPCFLTLFLPRSRSTKRQHLAMNLFRSFMLISVFFTSELKSEACSALMYLYRVSRQDGELSELMQIRRHSASARKPIKSSCAERISLAKVATRTARSQRPTMVPTQSAMARAFIEGPRGKKHLGLYDEIGREEDSCVLTA